LKKACVSSSWLQKLSKFLAIKEVLDKKPHHFWKIGRRAIFLRIYLNFKISDENWLFLGGGGSAKKHGTVYFLMFPIHSIIRVVLYGSLLASNIYWKYFSKILKNRKIWKFSRSDICVPRGFKGLSYSSSSRFLFRFYKVATHSILPLWIRNSNLFIPFLFFSKLTEKYSLSLFYVLISY
jgi:hypothetical protein